MNTIIQLKKVSAQKIEEGILLNHFKAGENIEIDDFRELRKVNMDLAEAKPYTVLGMADELTSFSKEAREWLASKETVGLKIAKAIVISSLGQRIIGNFYIKVNQPYTKTKLFTKREKALEWLRKEYRKYNNQLATEKQ